jgi:hypothetical protein
MLVVMVLLCFMDFYIRQKQVPQVLDLGNEDDCDAAPGMHNHDPEIENYPLVN